MGSNTVRLVVGERRDDGKLELLCHEVIATRLGEGLSRTGTLSRAGMDRTLQAVQLLRDKARLLDANRVEAYATEWARAATNTDEMLSRLAEIDLPVWVLTGTEEAAMSFAAVRLMNPGFNSGSILDLGGGSSEVILVEEGKASSAQSIPSGALNFTEKFLAQDIPAPHLDAALRKAEEVFGNCRARPFPPVVTLGGTAANFGALKVGIPPGEGEFFEKVQGLFLEREWLLQTLRKLAGLPLAERKLIPGIEPERADILVGGGALLHGFLSRAGADGFSICLYSFIHGVMASGI